MCCMRGNNNKFVILKSLINWIKILRNARYDEGCIAG